MITIILLSIFTVLFGAMALFPLFSSTSLDDVDAPVTSALEPPVAIGRRDDVSARAAAQAAAPSSAQAA